MNRPPRRPSGPTRGEIVRGIAHELEAAGLESPGVEAELLIATVLGVPRSHLRLEAGASVEPEQALAIARAVGRRLDGEPLQHIEGRAGFRHIELVSDRRALIPRPETEQLIDLVARWRTDRAAVERALDIGTGSGALALALLDEGLARQVLALDVSAEALALAEENATELGLEGVTFRPCPADIWSAVAPRERFDLIVSNPPYVTTAEWAKLESQVRDYEPRLALDGGADGLDVVRTIVAGAAEHLTPSGALFLEIGADQGPAVMSLLEGTSGLEEASIERDLSGRERFARAIRGTLE